MIPYKLSFFCAVEGRRSTACKGTAAGEAVVGFCAQVQKMFTQQHTIA